ncbi:MAG: glucose-6-phosphate dehydrogenase [Calditrichaceae bacterium]|nr:glucose-6-phosphate dehydrogenase [Calditrichaceae bacterium]MBN2709767.1 glucose-6-phosphate dehydrogenase [Calditrichaceae bacterium]RQV94961.1 MAG: glucose-6-phosphate dehydrogenase [Calditrichota bacterium]
MRTPERFLLVIFGGSGDLTSRKLIPSIYSLFRQNLLPDQFGILGLGRKDFNDDSYRRHLRNGIKAVGYRRQEDEEKCNNFLKSVFYHRFDMGKDDDYPGLKKRIEETEKRQHIDGNYMFYLAVPSEYYIPITTNLARHNLHKAPDKDNWRRVIIEKPFGSDLQTAKDLNRHLSGIFNEEQVFRIDHYLGKETVQNILAFRFANGIFEPLWNQNYIHHIEITAAENSGIEDRGGYYDSAGALRDMVQNHLLQIAAIVAMEPPALFNEKAVRDEKMKVFQSFRPLTNEDTRNSVIRGQYIESRVRGKMVKSYRQEKSIPADSMTETFVAVKCYIDNWRWNGVPFFVRTGKRLPARVTEVIVHFKKTPHHLFKMIADNLIIENQLILRIQPDEGILLNFGMKMPGAGFKIKKVGMDFHYSDLAESTIPEAYERLLLDAFAGDNTLYARADAVEESWKIIDPIISAWENDPEIKLYGYPAGTWGPKEARNLFDDPSMDWRYPCKNLTGEETYCEL